MYKVLLVDDEVLVRVGMMALIDWEAEGFHIVGEASNGQEALEHMKTLEPDIVLTDVKMPVMDGLELIKKARLCGFSCKFIILSAYDDFKYVKQALIDDARDYLLKLELEPESLLKTLRKVAEELPDTGGEEAAEEAPQKKLERILMDGDVACAGDLYDENCRIVAVLPEGAGLAADNGESLVNMMGEVAKNYGEGIWIWDKRGFCVGLLKTRDWDCTGDIWKALNQMIRYAFNTGCYMGMSDILEQGEDMGKARDEAVKSAEAACFNECGFLLYNHGAVREHSGPYFLYEDRFLKMEEAVEKLNLLDLAGELESLTEVFRTEILSPVMAMKICNIIHFIMNKGARQWGLEDFMGTKTGETMAPMLRKYDYTAWLEQMSRKIRLQGEEGPDRFLTQVKLLILPHLDRELTLEYVAEKIGYSSSHFSRVFKQKAGIGFSAYVTRMRMEQAKRYLEQEEWKIYEIASKTGYENATYFSRIFHQEVGMTPIEYRMARRGTDHKE